MFAIKYALKSISRRKQKNMLTVLSVTLAVTLLVGVGAASNGIYGAFASAWWDISADTDISISEPATDFFPANITDMITASDDARLDDLIATTTAIEIYGSVVYSEGKIVPGTQIFGIETDDPEFGNYYDLDGKVIDLSVLEGDKVIISKELSIELDVKVGDEIQTSVDNGLGESIPLHVEIVEIYDAQLGRGRENVFRAVPRIIINLEQIQSRLIAELQDHVTVIRLAFLTVENGGELSRDLEDLDIDEKTFVGREMLEEAVEALEDLLQEDRPLSIVYSERISAADNIKDNIAGIIGVLNLFVFMLNLTALLLIINVQAMNFDDRAYQTAVLRAMGTSRGSIFRIFLIESALVGVVGSAVGLLVGLPYGDWMQGVVNEIFDMPNASSASANLSQSVIVGAFMLGILLSISTAALPAWYSSGNSITEELRGIKSTKVKKSSNFKTISLGVVLFVFGLMNAQQTGEFWELEVWKNIENHLPILLSFGLSLAGLGLLLTRVNKKIGLNITGISILALAYLDMFWGFSVVEEGNGNNLFTILLLYQIIGSAMLVIVNFDAIMGFINKVFFFFPSMRAISQVTTRQLVKKKSRATLLFTIFTIILIINVFVSTMSTTMTGSLVNQYEWRAQGNDIVVNTEVSSDNITQVIAEIDGVTQVYSFRSAWMPVFYGNPNPDSEEFNVNDDLRWRQIIELKESVINPNGNWDEESYVITIEQVDSDLYDKKIGMSEEELMDLSRTVMKDFFDETTYDLEMNYTSKTTGEETFENFDEHLVLGGFFAAPGSDVFIQGKNDTVAVKRVSMSNDFLGGCDGFGCSIMVTETVADKLEMFDYVPGANLFLVKSDNGYFEDDKNQELALEIQMALNDLDDPQSLSSEMGVLVGATTRLIHTQMATLWNSEASFWDFLATFASIGLVIGGAGMAIIAMRSVGERLREIGMMRAIGFSRNKVVISVVIEMVFLGIFGLITGIINGLLMAYMFARNIFEVRMMLPWDTLGIYAALILGVSIISAIIPGMRAARIAPSQALRYTG